MTNLPSSSSAHREENEKVLLLLLNVQDYDNESEYKTFRAWFIIRDTDQQFQCYKYLGDVHGNTDDISGTRSTVVGTSLFLIGGQDYLRDHFIDQDMCCFDTSNPNAGWKTCGLPFYTSHAQITTHHDFIYIFPFWHPFYYKGVEDPSGYLPYPFKQPRCASQPYIYDTKKEKGYDICGVPSLPYGMRLQSHERDAEMPSERREDFFHGFRVCASWDEHGLLVSGFGEEIFYLHDPLEDVWIPLTEFEPLPKFSGTVPYDGDLGQQPVRTVSTISNGTLYCCDLPDKLHVYDLSRGKLNFSQHLLLFSQCLDWRLLPTSGDEILFVGCTYEDSDGSFEENTFCYIKVKVFKDFAEVVKKVSFKLPIDIRNVMEFMLIDPNQLQINSRDFEETSIKHPCIEEQASDKKIARVEFSKVAYHGAFDLGIMKSVPSCAYCCLVRRHCPDDCIFSPYFPSSDPATFAMVHNFLGADKFERRLQELPVHQRADAAKNLVDEARSEYLKHFWKPEFQCRDDATIEAIEQGERSLPRYYVRVLNPAAQPFVPRRRPPTFSDHLVLGTYQGWLSFAEQQ